MQLDPQPPLLSTAGFTAMGTAVTVVVERPASLGAALDAVRSVIGEIDATCSRFRDDSELSVLNQEAGGGARTVSRLLAEALAVALAAAEETGGLVDPTVGSCLVALGYRVTFRDIPDDLPPLDIAVAPAPGWRVVDLDITRHIVVLPRGVAIDLGATGKAWAADRAAAAAAEHIGAGVAVDCGGDVAVAGPPPRQGWPVRVWQRVGAGEWQDVHLFEGGLATSGPDARAWRRGSRRMHHIVEPATGLPVVTPWRMATVAASSCAGANAAATAALLLGARAPVWLEGHGLPARLIDEEGVTHILGAWPAPLTAA